MTPKEKAMELVKKFRLYAFTSDYDYAENGAQNEYYNAKQCALIAVDEIFENVDYFFNELEKDGLPNKFDDEIEYWQEVKQQITKL